MSRAENFVLIVLHGSGVLRRLLGNHLHHSEQIGDAMLQPVSKQNGALFAFDMDLEQRPKQPAMKMPNRQTMAKAVNVTADEADRVKLLIGGSQR